MRRYLASVCIAAVLLLPTITPTTIIGASASGHHAKEYRAALSTAQTYFQVLNTGMASGDFSGLSTVFAPNATLTKSGTDGKTAVYQGLPQITAFYQGLYAKLKGWQWATDELRRLNNHVVLAYEHAGSPPLTVASRCVHVFVIKKGMIQTYDWAAFYPGQP